MTDKEIIKEIEKEIGFRLRGYQRFPNEIAITEPLYVYNKSGEVTALTLSRSKNSPEKLTMLIGGLKNLQRLGLYECEVSDITVLSGLQNLSWLHLARNKIKDISPLQNLRSLKTLSLYGNEVTDVSPLQSLSQLEYLDLSVMKGKDISIVKNFPSLVSFRCNSTDVADFTPLIQLKKLTRLDIQGTRVKDISFITELPLLESMDLSYNKGLKDISPVGQLKKLTLLEAQHTGVKKFKTLEGATNLEYLNVSGSGIKDISFLENLSGLTHLRLEDNKITDIAPLRNLTALKLLELSNNQITQLPSWIVETPMNISYEGYPNGIRLNGNPLKDPPPEIIEKGRNAIRAWFSEGKIYVNEIKVLLVGHGEVGKTTLVKCLMDKTPDPHELATPNIKITTHQLPYNGKNVKLHFWDFGGQEVMHSTHQFFLSKRSVYILVLDGRRDEDAEYWLKHIESFGGDSPTLVVLNKMDANPGYEVDRRFLMNKYPFIVGFYKTSCMGSLSGIPELRQGLQSALDKVELLKSPWPKSWVPVKQELEEMKADFISQEHYNKLCEKNGIKDEDTWETLAEYLNDLGIIVHFKNELRLRNLHILQPRWVSRAAYKIINSEKTAKNHGLLKIEWMDELMKKHTPEDYEYQRSTYSYILDLMKKFELCYAVKEDKEFLIPELMDIQQPELPGHAGPVLRFYFQYQELLPRSIMARFIVRMHEDIKDDLRWRTGVVLQVPELRSMAIVIADIKEKRINISISGTYRREHFAIIRKAFYGLHKDFEKLPVTEWVPLPDVENHAVQYEELLGCEEEGDEEYKIYSIKRKYNVIDLLNGIEPENIRRGQYRWDVFLSYSTEDIDLIRQIAADLKKHDISYWLDEEQIKPGDSIIDVITEGALDSRYMVPCISKNQLRSSWSKKEYQSILHRIISGKEKQRVIPLVTDDTRDDEIPLFLGDLNYIRYQNKKAYRVLMDYIKQTV